MDYMTGEQHAHAAVDALWTALTHLNAAYVDAPTPAIEALANDGPDTAYRRAREALQGTLAAIASRWQWATPLADVGRIIYDACVDSGEQPSVTLVKVLVDTQTPDAVTIDVDTDGVARITVRGLIDATAQLAACRAELCDNGTITVADHNDRPLPDASTWNDVAAAIAARYGVTGTATVTGASWTLTLPVRT